MVRAHVAEVAAPAGGADGLEERLLGAERLDHRVRTEPAGRRKDPVGERETCFCAGVRGARGLSVSAPAERSEVSRRMLTQIELE
ncbi:MULTISPECIES: hypothetical protein [Actinoalloteichus]|uniref:Uncharacterized protein n=1 Tax=Actinoalloteichus fjordicus TaxID=1612552 RepID=A0AAC9LFL8_9PSEU|nr:MULTISPECIES: hypothetical protein [Actinoalloteichus]APU15344.1 hypothetical protein UA74_16570 [Actinoalloteichus fjordicus]APU21411.1 hypothetical protein UA75_17105 [Actinoalloteichus sp. GBA129-24]